MTWKDIAVFADGSRNGLARAEFAAQVARHVGGRLCAHVVAVLPDPLPGGAGGALEDARDEIAWVARTDAGAVQSRLRERALLFDDRLVLDAPEVAASKAGQLVDMLLRVSDVAVVARPIAQDASHLDDIIFTRSLFHSGRPCIVLPPTDETAFAGGRILVAWKAGREAARAVHDALDLLVRAHEVMVFTAADPAQQDVEGLPETQRLVAHLKNHGVRAQLQHERAPGSPGDAILSAARAWGAYLIVMGAFAHGRVREQLLGGATQTVLRAMTTPVLMSH